MDGFEKIRRNGFYYIDKTKLIEQLFLNWGEVNLFTRPRRFGKTLNMSMLKSFFEIGTDPSLFEGLLTCGSWIKDVIDTNKYLEKVVLIGTSDKLLKQVDKTYLPKLVEFKESQLCNKTAWDDFAKLHFNYPIYISIDKDVLDPDVEVTNWDQGATTIQQLKKLLSLLLTHDKLIGIDICGECNYSIKGLLDDNLRKDDTVNRLLLKLCEKEII